MNVYKSSVDFVESLERGFPVDEWICENVHVWPLLRIRLGFRYIAANSELISAPGRQTKIQKALEIARGTKNHFQRYASYRPWKACDAIFLSDGKTYISTGNMLFERILDPIRYHVHQRGLVSNCLIMTPPSGALTYLPTSSIYLDLQRAWHMTRPLDLSQLSHKDEFFETVSRQLGEGEPRQLELFCAKFISVFLSLAARFHVWLLAASPTVCFVENYYSVEAMAFTAAARRLGIPTVEIQHGVQGGAHLAYSRWTRIPEGGYESMPSWFWTWSEREAKNIRLWSDGSNGVHRVVCGGDPFLEFWKEGLVPGAGSWDLKLETARRKFAGKTELLVTLSGFESSEELEQLMHAIHESNNRYVWWLRAHPARLHQIADIQSRIGIGVSAEVLLASEAPLQSVLARVAVHVTGVSSVAIDAEAFGIPTVFIKEEGGALFAGQLAPEFIQTARYASLIEAIDRLVEKGVSGFKGDMPKIADAFTKIGIRKKVIESHT